MTEIIFREPTPEEISEREAWAVRQKEIEHNIVEDARRAAYQLISDPLFFGWQRGDNTEQEWLDAVEAIKEANPYPAE